MAKFSIALLVSVFASFFATEPVEEKHKSEPTPPQQEWTEIYAPTPPEGDGDTTKIKSNPNDRVGDPTHQPYVSPFFLSNPSNMKTSFELSEDGMGFNIYERVGKVDIRQPSYIKYEDYLEYRKNKGIRDYFKKQSMLSNQSDQEGLRLDVDVDGLNDIFGGGTISIRPTGTASLNFSIDHNRTDNPALPQRQQRTTIFNFDQQIQLGVVGKIGEKLRLSANFDTQATFDFENKLKLEYTGSQDEIIQKIEAGNVSMRLGNSLIQGRQNLFGLKTKLRFGPVEITAIASNERGKTETINVAGGGAIETPFTKQAGAYDENRHFFLSHYFRSKYEEAMSRLPLINSNLRIQRVEVWLEQQGATRNTRNAMGLIDVGENDRPFANGQGVVYNDDLLSTDTLRLPDNRANNLFEIILADPAFREMSTAKSAMENPTLTGTVDFVDTEDFQVLGNMRRLETTEYTLNTQLGYISLNTPVPNDQVLFVAFNYSLNGRSYQVGEFSDDIPSNGLNSNVLFLKKLKSSVRRVNPYPAWDLMMKNIYNIGYNIQEEGFFLDVIYQSPTSAGKINYLPEGVIANVPLMQVLNIDQLTNNTAPGPDNYFDYVEGITILANKGLVMFPVLEPFGSHLTKKLNYDANDSAKYVFQPLYDDTPVGAVQGYPHLDRYSLEGYYRSSSSAEIPLNTFNLQEGSVTVTANGRQLVEGQDFQVDYFGGKVTIINQSILASGQDIQVSYESSSLYNVQNKTLLGARAEMNLADNLKLGLTILNLKERPFNLKTAPGDEPINNTLWGMDARYQADSRLLTQLLDKLPGFSTKEISSIRAEGEFAQFIPGQPKVINTSGDEGLVYLDDFEAASNPFTLQAMQRWKLASFPNDTDRRTKIYDPTEDYPGDALAPSYSRAQLAWYQIDQAFYQGFGITVPKEDLSNNYTRRVTPFELFPTADRSFGTNIQQTFDLFYRPDVRGPNNYQTDPARIDSETGLLINPEESWGGIMRQIDINNDFDATNVQVLEFWLMDPFMDSVNSEGGDFYINLGLVNEDILPDQILSRENGLPGANQIGNVDSTAWGRVPIGNPITSNFSTDGDDRTAQDVGYDGLNTINERSFFEADVLGPLRGYLSPEAFAEVELDPSSDDFKHFRDDDFENRGAGILERYHRYNGVENNSPIGTGGANFTTQATNLPDTEDLNDNGSLNYAEQYWEYKIRLTPDSLMRGIGYVVDEITDTVPTDANSLNVVRWLQFRIPLDAGRPVNGIPDFRTISYMRMFLTGFKQPIILRMTELQLVATQWRTYLDDLREPGVSITPPEPPFSRIEVGNVSLEQNSTKLPFNYIMPPDVIRQSINGNTNAGVQQDEKSMQLKVCDLQDGDARAVFKTAVYDMRLYENLRMWVHAEGTGLNSNFEKTGDATVFIRLGSDNDFNYYEYEIPLHPSNPAFPSVQDTIWPSRNEFNFELALMSIAKQRRNEANIGPIYRFMYQNPDMKLSGHRIWVKGTPSLSDVKNIMIGLRNPKDPEGKAICVELWVNELRLTNFVKKTGWATNANASIKLADLGTLNGSIFYRTAGFGPLEQKITERSTDNVFRFDVSLGLKLDKFLPRRWGLQMPIYLTYGENLIDPVFNPQEADVPIDILIENSDPAEAARIRSEVQHFTRKRSISFTNWRKLKNVPGPAGGKARKPSKSHFYDISNFDFTFAFNDHFQHSSTIERLMITQTRFGINYRFNLPQVSIEPFKKVKFKPIQWINFSPVPTSFTYSIMGNRRFEDRLMRPTNNFGGETLPTYTKNFIVNTNWTLAWNLTRNLQFTWTSNTVARVDEVKGYWDQASKEEQDSVGRLVDNLISFGQDPERNRYRLINIGRVTDYTHNFNLTWQVPFNQFKALNWISSTAGYSAGYIWRQAPEISPELGGTIGNNQNVQLNGRLDLNAFYRKFKGLKKILDSKPKQARNAKPPQPKPAAPDTEGADPKAKQDSTRKFDPWLGLKIVGRELVKVLLSVKSVDVNFTQNNATSLPGYLPYANQFGLHFNYIDPETGERTSSVAPGVGFIFGDQRDIRPEAAQNGWLSRDTTLSSLYRTTRQEQITGRASIEPFKGFRIDVNVSRNLSLQESEFFKWDPALNNGEGDFAATDQQRNGSFSMTYIFVGTAFEKNEPISENFQAFSDNRVIISERLQGANPESDNLSYQGLTDGGYKNGYLGVNQDVLLPSFLSAYGITGPEKVDLSPLPKIPLPNWSVTYSGLSQIAGLKKIFSTITIRHAYRATYTVGSFINNLNAVDRNGDGFSNNTAFVGLDSAGNTIEDFYSINTVPVAAISEQFSPLIGIQVTTKKGITVSIDYKTGRQLTFSVGSLQLTESKNQDFSLLLGFRKDKLNLFLNLFGKEMRLSNTLDVKLRATIRNTIERARPLGTSGTDPLLTADPTRGSLNIIISPTIDYIVNRRLRLQFFVEHNTNNPYVSNSYKTTFTSAGVKIRFTLSN